MTLFAAVAFAGQAWAEDFTSGNLKYTITDAEKHEVSVGKISVDNKPEGDLVIPAEVENGGVTYTVITIRECAFRDCSGLTSVTISDSVTSIGDSAFYFSEGLKSVTIGNSVTSIGEGAFYFCKGLKSITIPNSVTSIGEHAFYYCSGLTSVTIGNSVTSIGEGAFYFCEGLKSVTIGNSVTNIGDLAFEGCKGLTSVTIPDSVTSIGEYAFAYCSGLKSVTIPNSVTNIGKGAFCNVKNIVYSGSAEGSPWYALNANAIPDEDGFIYSDDTKTKLTAYVGDEKEVVIPNSVTEIGDFAFDGCSGLKSVTIGNSVTEIGDFAFFGCSGLTSVTIPNSVTSIGVNAFYNCSGLTTVFIPKSVIVIGVDAFSGVTATIYCEIKSIPDDWSSLWYKGKVVWGYKPTPVTETAANAVNIYARGKNIVVENATEEISVYDAMGRLVCRDVACRARTINVKNTGIYIVKVGNIAKRVAIN